MMLGDPDPRPQLTSQFCYGSTPSLDQSEYPPFDELRSDYDEVGSHTMRTIEDMSDDDLDRSAVACPPELAGWFGTSGQCLMTKVIHPCMHYG